jgi:hypothetical protein
VRETVNIQARLAQYAPIRLKVDPGRLSDSERRLIPLLIEAAQAMDEPFWMQNYGDREALLASTADPDIRRYIQLNYGPWDRHHGDEPFIAGVGTKPAGANFYPPDMTRGEFETRAATQPNLKSPYTMVRRDSQGNLVAIPYYMFFRKHTELAANRLRQAADLAEESDLKAYLALRAEALLTDDYHPSDFAWVEMKTNSIDILIGPMEIEDRLLGIKTAYAASILIKDWHWTERLTQYVGLLSRFQENLPVPDAYKQERPGLDSELAVYDVIYYAGNDKASIPTGICWPDDEEVQLGKGTRSLLLNNVMQARFEKNLLPLADLLIAGDQRPQVTSEANFNLIMLHELAHGLGIKQTITNKGLAKEALKEQHHVIEEGKADLLSLVMISQLQQWGHMSEADLHDVYVTSLVRLLFNCDGRQSIMRLNFFKERGAYAREAHTGTYRVHMAAMQAAVNTLADRLLRFQGDGDYEGAKAFVERYGRPDRRGKSAPRTGGGGGS